MSQIDNKIINNIKALAIDMITNAGSGHPGIVLSAAPLIYTVFSKHLRVMPSDLKWPARDRFIMSAGHGSALLYSTLFMSGLTKDLEGLKNFRKINSPFSGHPEYNPDLGIEMTTGPLGQGLATAVGIAMSSKYLKDEFMIPSDKGKPEPLFDFYTYVLVSDGDLMEGVSYEATSLAGTLGLNNLIVLYDNNHTTLDGPTSMSFTEDIEKRFIAMNWQVINLKTDDVESIDKAIIKAKESREPSLIMVNTIIGKDTNHAGKNISHGTVLTKPEVTALKAKLGIRDIPFAVSGEAVTEMTNNLVKRVTPIYNKYQQNIELIKDIPELETAVNKYLQGITTMDVNSLMYDFDPNVLEPLRVTNEKIMNILSNNHPHFFSLSADLFSSTRTYLSEKGNYTKDNYQGKNIWCGVREHAMGAIMNGMALCNLYPVGSTFLAFSDYLRPSIRLAASMKLPLTYVFTHDSFMLGGDGSTHIPVEQLSSLRSIPYLSVFRPADAKELTGCWNYILNHQTNPSALVIARHELPVIPTTSKENINYGAYLIRQESHRLSGILIASGSEVTLALTIANELAKTGIDLRVISMPSLELYQKQSDEYRNKLLPVGYKTIAIEAASNHSWYPYVYSDKYIISVNDFSLSGTPEELAKHHGFDMHCLMNTIVNLLK